MINNQISFLLFFILLCGCGETPRVMWQNYTAIRAIQKGDSTQAQEKLYQSIAKSPFRSELYNNLGFAILAEELMKQKKIIEMAEAEQKLNQQEQSQQAPQPTELPPELLEKAKQAFRQSEKWSKSSSQSMIAYFNQAVMLQMQKKYDEALVKYQAALEINPQSIEVKQNIELMQMQMQQQQQEQDKKDQEQNQQGGDSQDQKDSKDQKDKKDHQDQKENKDQQEEQDKKDQEKQKENQPKQYQKNAKPQPRPFESKELNEADAKKILGELKQQEQKIRAEYNRHESKEQPRDKDW